MGLIALKRKSGNIGKNKEKKRLAWLAPLCTIAALAVVWEVVARAGVIHVAFLPAPGKILLTTLRILPSVFPEIGYTLGITSAGFGLALCLGFAAALVMDMSKAVERSLHPLLVISQTIPTIALAPLFVLWFGYGILPKLLVIMSVCFFPIALNLLGGLQSAPPGMLGLLKSMGASRMKRFAMVKLPSALPQFFSGLKIAATYSIMGGVIAEWLGGNRGIGVYMIRVKRSYSYDKMFAAILIVVLLSLAVVALVDVVRRLCVRWEPK